MGFFGWIKTSVNNTFHKIVKTVGGVVNGAKTATLKVASTIGHIGGSVISTGSNALHSIIGGVGNVASTVYTDLKAGVGGVGHLIENVQNIGGNIASSFAWPLAVSGAGLATAYLLFK